MYVVALEVDRDNAEEVRFLSATFGHSTSRGAALIT